ncbi:MAG TPA: Fic family protein [Allosphingosinicella sp.]|nr:Fic family protein [Allosphingosinicella sp.]
MKDTNWDLIKGSAAHEIEVLNQLSALNQIEAMVHFSLHHYPSPEHGCDRHLSQNALKELHRTGTFLLLEKPGEYRTGPVYLELENGEIVYNPPAVDEIQGHLERFFAQLGERWGNYTPVETAAFTLWFINWVHPFKNGNGRSARGFCYACLSMRAGYVLPGERTVLELIKENDDEYQLALRAADAAFQATEEPDLAPMVGLIDRLFAEQLESALEA